MAVNWRYGPDRSVNGMTSHSRFTLDGARAAGERIGIDWDASASDLGQFRMGLDIELEHGTRDLETNVTGDDVTMTVALSTNTSGRSWPGGSTIGLCQNL